MQSVSEEFAEMLPTERAAHIAARLAAGEAFTARALSIQYHVSRQTAYRILDRTCRVLPLHNEEGVWRLLDVCRPG